MLERQLLNQIEHARRRLHLLAEMHNYNMQHPDVIKASTRLDMLLLRYSKLVSA